MISRRDLIKVGGVATATAMTSVNSTSVHAKASGRLPDARFRPLPLNKQRAYDVMQRYGLDGLIALRPHNVYYLSNSRPIATDFLDEFPAMATFPADPAKSGFFVGSLGSAWDLANGDRETPPIITYSGVSNWQQYLNANEKQMSVEPQAYRGRSSIAVREGAALTQREEAWLNAQTTAMGSSAPSPEWALVHALRESGMLRGRVAVDDMRVAWMLERIGVSTVTLIPGDSIFREIRLVKQPHEIDLMRHAQKASRNAALAAARALSPGMTYEDARAIFAAEAATFGADMAFLLMGMSVGQLPAGKVQSGQKYMIDCGASYHHYMGDFARTISVGDPDRDLIIRHKAQQAGREVALGRIRPGAHFSQIEQIARDAIVAAGMPSHVLPGCTLHSVGLQHADQPHRWDAAFPMRPDLVLEEGMCVTLDLPYMELGWGAGHNEDLLLITRNGYELLNSPDDSIIVV